MATHELKTWPEYFQQIKSRAKTFELRKNDRNFQVGDTLILKEFEPSGYNEVSPNEIVGQYTGEELKVKVDYIFAGHHDGTLAGLSPSYCIMSISLLNEAPDTVQEDLKEAAHGQQGEAEIFNWLFGYYDFPEYQLGKGRFYWRSHLRERLKSSGYSFAEDGKVIRPNTQPSTGVNTDEAEEEFKYPSYKQSGGDKSWDEMTELEQSYYNQCKILNALALYKTNYRRLRDQKVSTVNTDSSVLVKALEQIKNLVIIKSPHTGSVTSKNVLDIIKEALEQFNTGKGEEHGIDKDLIIAGLEEGAENWKAEYDNCRAILQELVDLKTIKDTYGTRVENYETRKPLAWDKAKEFLSKYQHL